MKRTVFVFVVTFAAVLALSQVVLGADAIVGTWKQNMAQSKYSPANLAPKSGTTKIEAVAGGIKLTADGVDNEGRKTHTEYTATFDGKEAKVTATIDGKVSPNQDGVVWKKIDDNTYENIAKLKGQTLTTTRTVVSKDGKTRTNTVTGKNAQGQTVSNTVVYDRQ
jgi:hypothetical protein